MLHPQIRDRLASGEWSAWDAIRWRLLPESLTHAFACDCIARIGHREEHCSAALPEAFWSCLRDRRLWALKMLSMVGLKRSLHAAQGLYPTVEGALRSPRTRAFLALVRVMNKEPLAAAMGSMGADVEHHIMHQLIITSEIPSGGLGDVTSPLRYRSEFEDIAAVEEAWQHRRLAWLCDAWLLCGERTPWLLYEGELPFEQTPQTRLDFGLESEPDAPGG